MELDIKQNTAEIKSVKDRLIHGVGVRFGSETDVDADNEFFTEKSEVGLMNGANRPFILEHGWHPSFNVSKVADAVFEKSGKGWEYSATFLDTEIGNKAFVEVTSKQYCSSAGAAGHTRRATTIKGTIQHLDTWFIAEQSVTLNPADRNNPHISQTKNNYILFAIEQMMANQKAELNEFLTTMLVKDNDARQALADALTSLRTSFSSGEKFVVTPELLAAIEQVTKPIPLIGLGK